MTSNTFLSRSSTRSRSGVINIYPDGGVARLKVGEADDGLGNEDESTQPNNELSALRFGGRVVTYSNAHYGNPEFIWTPGRGKNMGDGWETARRRVPGNEWIIIRLGRIGIIERLRSGPLQGNGMHIAGCLISSPTRGSVGGSGDVLGRGPELQRTDRRLDHSFDLRKLGAVSHVKLNIYPDGGVSRVILVRRSNVTNHSG